MILLIDEEILEMRSTWLTTNCPNEVTATKIALERLREMNKAQLKKVVEEKEGLGKFAKAYDMRIDGFVVPWDYWQALLEETK